jgi:isopenicillin N synthase-like dioxygenase
MSCVSSYLQGDICGGGRMDRIPLVDITKFHNGNEAERKRIAAAVGDACEAIGFLYVSGHGVPTTAISDIRDVMVRFFSQPESKKLQLAAGPNAYRGYIPMASLSANAGTIEQPDLYEGYKLHAEKSDARPDATLVTKNVWPDEPPEFRAAVTAYWREMDRLSDWLLRIFALSLALPERTFVDHFVDPMTNMTLLHYPPMDANASGFGIHPHKDSDAFTILYPDPVGGLEVQPIGGNWIVADCPPDAFVVNIGNMMELWSGGRFQSTPHKVVNRSGTERYSFPYFAIPNERVVVTPISKLVNGFKGTSLHVGEFMNEIYRTNQSDQKPRDQNLDLGTINR